MSQESEAEYLFQIPIGDWSGDGHSQCEWFTIKANVPMKDIWEAYFNAQLKIHKDVWPESICSEYEQSSISEDLLDKIKSYGFDKFNEDDYIEPEMFLTYVMWFICRGNENIKLSKADKKNLPKLINWEAPEGKQIGSFGYGLLGS